jgi:hypothetical protein
MEHVVLSYNCELIGLPSGASWNGYVVLVPDSYFYGSGVKSISFLHFLVQHCSIIAGLFSCPVIFICSKIIHAPLHSLDENHSRVSLMHSPSLKGALSFGFVHTVYSW